MVARYFSIVDDDTFLHQKVFMTTPMSVNWVNYPKQVAVVSVSLEAYGVRPYRTILGFVVCPRTSDPKLVKITYINYQKEYPTIPDQVEVFSLSSGLWKRLTGKLPRKSIAYMNPQKDSGDSKMATAPTNGDGDWIGSKLFKPNNTIDSIFRFFFLVLGTRSGLFRRVGRTFKGVTTSSSATSSSTSYYGASKRYSQEEVNESSKEREEYGKRISAYFNKKLVNLMTKLAEKGISLDKTPVIDEEDEEYEESDDEAIDDVDDGMEYEAEGMDDEDDQ
ncbi:hypothetical protein Tco_0955766 [Tanacetum coccineum]|uniref:Uncharacterized protein n=1 Tax=Tanacetum coccineum TaxID=301880 RepID=A0ABQ5E890_9ASTR